MIILHILRLSLLLPRKQALFQLNRVKTKGFFLYIIFLSFLLLLPNGIRLVSNSINSGGFQQEYLLILLFYPFMTIALGIVGISMLAGFGMLIKKASNRKIAYQLLWRMAVYALTYPVLLYTLFDLIDIQNMWINLLLLLIFMVIFSKMILVYPKPKK